jgi:Zn-dependent hydrolases, including glyoxylases
MLQENCYVVNDDSKECVIIDCGIWYEEEFQALKQYIEENSLTLTRLLATHGHLDHNFGNNRVFKTYALKPEIAKDDEFLLNNLNQQAEEMFGLDLPDDYPQADKFVSEEQTISFGSHKLKVIATPGHSPGSVCFYEEDEKILFSGDTLFRMSVGRTDLQGGNYIHLMNSLRKLSSLPDNVTIMPGHGPQTTVGEEKMYNPYMRL